MVGMKFTPILLLLVFICSFSRGESTDEKFRQLQKMAKRSPVIHFDNAETYHKLVTDGTGRNYSFFILFTATQPKYKCGPCVALAEEMKNLGVSYEAYFEGDYQSDQFLNNPLFLAKLEPDECMEVFQGYQFSTVPHFVYIPAGTKKITKLRDDQFLRNPQTSIHDIIDFINKKISVEIPVYQPPLERYTPLLATVVLIVLVVRLVRKFQDRMYDPMLWYGFALVTYMIVMAGVVYNRIRNPPLMDIQQGGRTVLISPSPRTQYVAEGIIVAIVLGGAGVVFVALGDWVPRVGGTSGSSSSSSSGGGPWKKRVAFWFSAVLLFMFLTTLNNIFQIKYHMSAFRLNWRFF